MTIANNFELVISFIESTLQQALLSKSAYERQALIEAALKELQVIRKNDRKIIQLGDFYDNAPVGFYSLDEKGLIISANRAFFEWTGYNAEEVVGKMHLTQLFDDDARDNFFKTYEQFLRKEIVIKDTERVFIRKDKSTFFVLLNVSIIEDENGNFVATHSVVTDITAEKTFENELKATTEQLYQANDAKNKFIGFASHDLQNPITAITMSTELLKKNTPHPTPVQQKLLGNIKSAADRMNYLVSNILIINRIERGMVSDDWRTVHLKSLVWDIVNRNQIFAQRKNIYIHQFADDTTDWRILTEPNYLTQAVENILSNAIKFSHKNKSITIELRRRGDEMDILIEDEGQGIKAEEMPRLFGRFQKLSARPTGNEISTGLGLSVAKEFVDVLRGRISVKSEWAIGTTFTVTLPVVPVFEVN